jgi:hypothetical protein
LQEIKCSKDKLPAEVKVYVNQEPVLKSTHWKNLQHNSTSSSRVQLLK